MKGTNMAKKATFTPAQKAQAMLMLSKGMTARAVVAKIGCSPASLQIWKKDYKEGKFSLDDLEETEAEYEEEVEEEEEYTPAPTRKESQTKRHPMSKEEFIKKYWQSMSVDDVSKMPKSIDEVVTLVNDGLSYAYSRLGD
jgi:hypothetical protein